MRIERRKFLECAGACGAVLGGFCPALDGEYRSLATAAEPKRASLTLRPYQFLCLLCAIGEDGEMHGSEKLKQAHEAIRKDPDIPVTVVCNVGDVFAYQDPDPRVTLLAVLASTESETWRCCSG